MNDPLDAVLTLAHVRQPRGAPKQILFHESNRIFTLGASAARDRVPERTLTAALEKRRPVRVRADAEGEIVSIADVSDEEATAFRKAFPKAEGTQKARPIDLAKIDPTVFDFVGPHLRWPPFDLCTRIVPSYAKAKEIFDFCASQSCHLGAPPNPPCIPFQYVRDGCYARAHQMRRLILQRYRYCVEKVFSYATAGNDRLAVQANKWGGCCVTWWYHVAPVVRVRVPLRIYPHKIPKGPIRVWPKLYPPLAIAMVIDPGMFDAPVRLSTWLAAQENTTCYPNARVTSYSIQPGSAYTPGYNSAYGTDPNYVHTEATLLNYANLTTC